MDLVPIVVQDVHSGAVLMVGYGNEESRRATEETGFVHFWSRSRNTLWKKGETSGNTLRLVDAVEDCDGDAVLVRAEPAGPTCHTGTTTCFGDDRSVGFAALAGLHEVIADRAATRPAGSYTVELLDGGVDACARKVVEEAAEVAFAAKDHAAGNGDAEAVAGEAADLLYHLLVLLAERGVDPGSVMERLVARRR